MNLLNAFKVRLNTLAIVLIPVCIGIDWAGHAIAKALNLPLFGDSIGTVLGSLLAGPWVGALAGFVTNFISFGTIDPVAGAYSIISLAIGFAAGIAGYLGWQKRIPWGWVALWILVFVVASVGSTPLNLWLSGGQSYVPSGDAILAALLKAHVPTFIASYIDEASVDLPDKLITVLIALFIYQGLPQRFRALFRVYKPSDEEREEPTPARA
jgi:energy-coupling factor transport system substrate-specific component